MLFRFVERKFWYFALSALLIVPGVFFLAIGLLHAHVTRQLSAIVAGEYVAAPTVETEEWSADWGVFAQDSWVLRKLTVNYGLRWEYFKAGIPAHYRTAATKVMAS